MVTAEDFLQNFKEAYCDCSRRIPRPRWEGIWGSWSLWNSFMLWRTAPTKPQELEHSVLASTALRLGLEYWEREPLRLDGVFYETGARIEQNFPFPIIAAIEHENDIGRFSTEICRLLSVRCPLKIGITYELRRGSSEPTTDRTLSRLRGMIAELGEKANQAIPEAPRVEYLFLVGIERRLKELEWWALSFRADEAAAQLLFLKV